MPYEFAENEFELEPASSSARYGGPPHKVTGIGILDPPVPPKRPPGPTPFVPASLFLRILGGPASFGSCGGNIVVVLCQTLKSHSNLVTVS